MVLVPITSYTEIPPTPTCTNRSQCDACMQTCSVSQIVTAHVQYFCRTQCDIEKPPCILLLHVVFQTFSCRRRLLASCGITGTLSKSLVLYLEHQLIPPHYVLFPITAVAPPPHTPGPAQTEATSQPQPSVSLREAARKWAMYCSSMHEPMCVTLFRLHVLTLVVCGSMSLCVHLCVLYYYPCMGMDVGTPWSGVHVRTYICVYVFACSYSSLQFLLPLQ